MDKDAEQWLDEAIRIASRCKTEIAVLMRNDDFNLIVCSSQNPDTIRALGEALTGGYKAE